MLTVQKECVRSLFTCAYEHTHAHTHWVHLLLLGWDGTAGRSKGKESSCVLVQMSRFEGVAARTDSSAQQQECMFLKNNSDFLKSLL